MKVFCKLLLAVLFVGLGDVSFSQRLNGSVRSYGDTYYSIREIYGKIRKGAKLNDSLYHNLVVHLDSTGNVVQATEHNSEGAILCTFFGHGDYKDNNQESVFVRFEHEMIFDRKPFLICSVKYPSGEMCGITYKNDQNGMPVEATIYDLMGTSLCAISTTRDNKGNPLQYQFSNGALDKYKYDEKGRRIEWLSRSASGKTTITFYKYNEQGNVIEEIIKDFFKSSYKYHDEFNTYTYKYDKMGNWTEKNDFEHNIPMRMIIRSIEYTQ